MKKYSQRRGVMPSRKPWSYRRQGYKEAFDRMRREQWKRDEDQLDTKLRIALIALTALLLAFFLSSTIAGATNGPFRIQFSIAPRTSDVLYNWRCGVSGMGGKPSTASSAFPFEEGSKPIRYLIWCRQVH